MKCLVPLALLMILSGCASLSTVFEPQPVKPWERDILAREHMQLTPDTMDSAVDEHIYFSKEASSGGASIQGGGCGCN